MLNTDLQLPKYIDSTNLNTKATFSDIESLCQNAAMYQFVAVCVLPFYVEFAKNYLFATDVKICSVVGFPLGANLLETKLIETEQLLKKGSNEIDMMINISALMNGDYDYVRNEIQQITELCHSENAIIKVIIETCLLSEEQKIDMCKIVADAGADYIKTSTGFSTAGATIEDIRLFRFNLDQKVKMKASGGINDLKTMHKFLKLGVTRIGTSKAREIIDELIRN